MQIYKNIFLICFVLFFLFGCSNEELKVEENEVSEKSVQSEASKQYIEDKYSITEEELLVQQYNTYITKIQKDSTKMSEYYAESYDEFDTVDIDSMSQQELVIKIQEMTLNLKDIILNLKIMRNHFESFKEFLNENDDALFLQGINVIEVTLAAEDAIINIDDQIIIYETAMDELKTSVDELETIDVLSIEEQVYDTQIVDNGDFKLSYIKPTDEYYDTYYSLVYDHYLFDEKPLNDLLALPEDVSIYFTDCGENNAYYDSSNKKLVMCYELFEYIITSFYNAGEQNPDELGTAVIETTYFVYYHELGHALVDVLELPITGKEEDAVDQLSTLLLIYGGWDQAALRGAVWFYLSGLNIEELNFADEHSLDTQRFYNIACWVYGSNPDGYSYLVEEGYLPEDRAIRCPQEFEQLERSWITLLAPYVKG